MYFDGCVTVCRGQRKYCFIYRAKTEHCVEPGRNLVAVAVKDSLGNDIVNLCRTHCDIPAPFHPICCMEGCSDQVDRAGANITRCTVHTGCNQCHFYGCLATFRGQKKFWSVHWGNKERCVEPGCGFLAVAVKYSARKVLGNLFWTHYDNSA
jgi:hypothetical protein